MSLKLSCSCLFFISFILFTSNAIGQVADTTKAFTLDKKLKQDSLLSHESWMRNRYLAYPVSLDSVYNPDFILPYHIQKSDLTGFSEIARMLPQVVAVPIALSSSRNRFMLYGMPGLANGVFFDGSVFGDYPDQRRGTDNTLATQSDVLSYRAPVGVESNAIPFGLVSPQTDALWENGVFKETMLGLRFVRPLTRTIDLSVFSNFRYLVPTQYTTANDLWSLYQSSFSDTSMLVKSGRNPMANENDMTIRLGSKIGKTGTLSASYSYFDSHTEEAMDLKDSAIAFRSLTLFANTARMQLRRLQMSSWFLNADVKLNVEGHTAYNPVDSTLKSEQLFRQSNYCLSVNPYRGFGADTIGVVAQGILYAYQLYNASFANAQTAQMRLSYKRAMSIGKSRLTLSGNAGDNMFKTSQLPLSHSLLYLAQLEYALGKQWIRAFASRDVLPFILPSDSLKYAIDTYSDIYESYGIDGFFGLGNVGVFGGVYSVMNTDSTISSRFWPDGQKPYEQPNYSVMVMPVVGRIAGFALSSRLLVSDKKPFYKSQSVLSYEVSKIFGREHIVVSAMLDYWSNRDNQAYGGTTLWNRDIVNLSLNTAVHMQKFSLFYKVDNILNRRYAYVPGYFMPGITFRWGFQWLIDG